MNKYQNYDAFNNNPYITASHQAALIIHVSVKVLLGLGSDVGIIIEGSIILIFVHRNCYMAFLFSFPFTCLFTF